MSDDRNKKKDLTSLTDLSELIHEDDPQLNKLLETHGDSNNQKITKNIDDDDDDEEFLASNTDPSIELGEDLSTPTEFPEESLPENDIDLSATEDGYSSDENFDSSSSIEEVNFESTGEDFLSTDFDSTDEASAFDDTNDLPTETVTNNFSEEEQVEIPDIEAPPAQMPKAQPPIPTKTIELPTKPASTAMKKEFVQDLQHFMNQYDIGVIKREGNPPFTLLIENIVTLGQKEEIKKILKVYKIVADQDMIDYEKQLDHECLLLTHLSEYSAIFLAEKIRKLKVKIKLGLSGSIRESEHYERDDFGIIGPKQLKQNHESSENFKQKEEQEWLLISNHMQAPGFEISEYLGLGQQSYYFDKKDLLRLKGRNLKSVKTPEFLENFFNEHIDQNYLQFKLRFKNELNMIFDGLVDRLRENATLKGANALLGIQFQVHQLSTKDESFMMNTTATLVKMKKK